MVVRQSHSPWPSSESSAPDSLCMLCKLSSASRPASKRDFPCGRRSAPVAVGNEAARRASGILHGEADAATMPMPMPLSVLRRQPNSTDVLRAWIVQLLLGQSCLIPCLSSATSRRYVARSNRGRRLAVGGGRGVRILVAKAKICTCF